jgi:integrase
MPRPATGSIQEDRRTKDTVYGLRFKALGKKHYQRCGKHSDGWNRSMAEEALKDVLAEVRLGTWRPPAPPVEEVREPCECPTFWAFAREWYDKQCAEGGRNGSGLSEGGKKDLKWRLNNHLRQAFGTKRLDQITVQDVDRYRLAKAGELNATSTNKTLAALSAILELAREYGHIDSNPAAGKKRRLKPKKPKRSHIDRADHIEALLNGASADGPRWRDGRRRALLATLTFAGLRLSEALALEWRDVDLARSTITVRTAKSEAGIRTVDILPALHDELDAYKMRLSYPDRTALVFATNRGTKYDRTKIGPTMLKPAVEKANEALTAQGQEPLAEDLTPHSLRRTFASILFAVGEAPPYVMAQLGHTDPTTTLSYYAKAMARRDGEPGRLAALVQGANGHQAALNGQRMDNNADSSGPEIAIRPALSGAQSVGNSQGMA